MLTYSLSGTDVATFSINPATGQLMVANSADVDFEDSGNADHTYEVTVTATDSSGDAGTTAVTINITDLNEIPTFTAGTAGFAAARPEPFNADGVALTGAELTTALTIGTYTVTDPEGGSVTLSLMGDDAGSFELNDPTGGVQAGTKVLAFKAMPDFEMPGDQNRDNVYEVTVRASDGVTHADRMVAVKVTNVNENGSVTLSSQDALIGVELTATLSDSDGGVPDPAQFTDQKWTWHRLTSDQSVTDVADENAIMMAASSTYTPVAADQGMLLAARVTYTDRFGANTTATSAATRAVQPNADNRAPKFGEGASTFRVIMENAAADADTPPLTTWVARSVSRTIMTTR